MTYSLQSGKYMHIHASVSGVSMNSQDGTKRMNVPKVFVLSDDNI